MDIARKYLALLEIAESSETGRQAVLTAVIHAARNALGDLSGPRAIGSIEDLVCLLADTANWPDESAWIDAVQRHLAEISIPAMNLPLNLN
jgi:hypothetical protein